MDCERSNHRVIRTEGGTCCRSRSTICRTASATATVFVPGCRWIASSIARSPLYQLPERGSCTPSITFPRSCSCTGEPLRYATTIERKAAASCSWPLAWTVRAFSLPHRMPVGRLALLLVTASTTSSMPMRRYASARGSSWMRTAYFCEPYTFTWATPSTVEMRCARYVSAYSSTVESGSVGEETAKYMIGEAAGFCLL